jgi:hypothetical protein
MTVSLAPTPSNTKSYVNEICALHSAILQKTQQFEETHKKTQALALRFNALRKACPTLRSEEVTDALADLIIIKKESDELLTQFGKKTYEYLFRVQGRASRLALAIHPRSEEAQKIFLKNIFVASLEEEEKMPKLIYVPEL